MTSTLQNFASSSNELTKAHQTAKTKFVDGTNGIRYAYRRFGRVGSVPLLCLIHFRGTMDYWDPLLINTIAAQREVILFDNAGVGQSSGNVADSIAGMAQHAIDFLGLLGVKTIDVLGFSMGGYTAPLVYLNGPKGLVRKIVIAGSGPSIGEGVVRNSIERQREIGQYAGSPEPNYENGFRYLFFAPSESSQHAGRDWYARIRERNEHTSGEQRSELVSFGYADNAVGLKAMQKAGADFMDISKREAGSFDRLHQIDAPVFIGQGHDDFMIPSHNSWVLQQKLPNARLKIFPDSGHGFLYQFAEEFGRDVNNFLDL